MAEPFLAELISYHIGETGEVWLHLHAKNGDVVASIDLSQQAYRRICAGIDRDLAPPCPCCTIH